MCAQLLPCVTPNPLYSLPSLGTPSVSSQFCVSMSLDIIHYFALFLFSFSDKTSCRLGNMVLNSCQHLGLEIQSYCTFPSTQLPKSLHHLSLFQSFFILHVYKLVSNNLDSPNWFSTIIVGIIIFHLAKLPVIKCGKDSTVLGDPCPAVLASSSIGTSSSTFYYFALLLLSF